MRGHDHSSLRYSHALQMPSGVLYRLDAIIVHLGAASSGHFLTVRRVPMSAEPAFKSWITGGPPYVSIAVLAHIHTHPFWRN